MAVYKVPQDVEADDKLIGPFSFRQFIYLVIVAISMALAWGLSQLFIPLAILPLPIIIFFGALALPLRKDQPMEIYLAAVVSFYLKPRKRLWRPDGIQSLVEITVPKVVETTRTKDLSRSEAEQRLSYLAGIVDTEGWAVRGVGIPASTSTPMQSDAYFSAQQAEDILDESTNVAKSFDTMIDKSDTKRRQELVSRIQNTPTINVPDRTTPTPPTSTAPSVLSNPSTSKSDNVNFNPYPTSMHQHVVAPLDEDESKDTSTDTSKTSVSPDIIDLANNPELSIQTIAHEAERIHKKEQGLPRDEVVIPLR
jgi:PrgI family protein